MVKKYEIKIKGSGTAEKLAEALRGIATDICRPTFSDLLNKADKVTYQEVIELKIKPYGHNIK